MARGRAIFPARAAEVVAPEQGFRVHVRLGRGQVRRGVRVQQHAVKFFSQARCQGRVQGRQFKAHLLAGQQGHVLGQKIFVQTGARQHGIGGQQGGFRSIRVEDRDRVALARKIPGRGQAGQPRTRHGHPFFLGGQGQGATLLARREHTGKFQPVHGHAAAQVAAKADFFTRVVAEPGQHPRQGQMPLQQLAGLAHAACGHVGHEGAHVQVKGAGRPTAGGAFLGTAGLNFVQTLLIHHGGHSLAQGVKTLWGKERFSASALPPHPAAKISPPAAWGAVCRGPWGSGEGGPARAPPRWCGHRGSLPYLGMASKTFSGRAGRCRTRAPQAL